jgi:hypothetical protein
MPQMKLKSLAIALCAILAAGLATPGAQVTEVWNLSNGCGGSG